MPHLSLNSAVNIPVGLQELLDSRENRSLRQKEYLSRHPYALVSVTVVSPGAIKDSELTRRIFNLCYQELMTLFQKSTWEILEQSVLALSTGLEGLIATSAEASEVKQKLIQLEETHTLGRLWDIDVLDKKGRLLSRSEFNYPSRKCFICDKDASICARNQTHAISDLTAHMEALLKKCL